RPPAGDHRPGQHDWRWAGPDRRPGSHQLWRGEVGPDTALSPPSRRPAPRLAPPAAVIIQDGQYLTDVMRKEGVDQEEVETAMREHGVAEVKDVQLGVLEPDGSISIVAPGNATRTKRKVIFHQRSR